MLKIEAELNDKGKSEFYGIFKSDRIPLISRLTVKAKLGPPCYFLAWDKLDRETQVKLFSFLAKKFNGTIREVEDHAANRGIPIRAELIYSITTIWTGPGGVEP